MWSMRMAWAWAGAVVAVALAIVGGVAIANATVFSASWFARDYLDALRSDRIDEVLALPGVDGGGLDSRLLDPLAVDTFEYELGPDSEVDGVHSIRVSFDSDEGRGVADLRIERVGTRFGVFPEWGFAVSPITPVTVALTGDSRFQVGEVPVELVDGAPATFAALTPGIYRFGHESEFLTADPVIVVASGIAADATLDIRPSDAFTQQVQAAMEADLTACAAQKVLFPSPCPFGHAIENRVVSEPVWTIAEMPTASIAASDRIGIWAVSPAAGVAHLSVQVQSLFDGSVSTLEQDVPFQAGYLIAFDGDQVVLDPRIR
jgi:hypothetical protein